MEKSQKFIPYEKLQKKRRRELDRCQRGSWGAISPVTKKPEKSTAYNRKKEARRWKAEEHGPTRRVFFANQR